jgi:3-oxoacyl-[acyl-carrier protein] reductase
MTDRFRGKVAIVTGSGQSIGRAIALLLAKEGARVVVNSRSERSRDETPTAADTAGEICSSGGEALAVFADVSRMDGARTLVDAAVASYGRVDILINNAGIPQTYTGIDELSEEHWDDLLGVNLKSQYACIHFAAPLMKRNRSGRILNVSSPIGLYGLANASAYCAAKAGTLGLTVSLAHEFAGTGITVNCILPSAVTTRNARSRAAREAATGRVVPVGANRTPDAIAAPAAHLVSDAVAEISGQLFLVAAGQIKHFPWPPPDRSLYKPGIWALDDLARVFNPHFGPRHGPVKPPPYLD